MNTKVTARARITYRILCITLQITFAYQKHCHGMGQRTQEVSSTLILISLMFFTQIPSYFPRISVYRYNPLPQFTTQYEDHAMIP